MVLFLWGVYLGVKRLYMVLFKFYFFPLSLWNRLEELLMLSWWND